MNLQIEARHADEHADRLPGLAAELVDRKVEVIDSFTNGAAMGLVASLAHPGGNITANEIGVDVPPLLLASADEVVE